MLIDDVTIKVSSGKGGDGIATFNKTKMSLGPTGGSGGKGGDVFVVGVKSISVLRHFQHKKKFSAEDGKNSLGQLRDGRDGKDLVLEVPTGTVIHNLNNKTDIEVNEIDQQKLLFKGGWGGRGNFLFRSSRNTTPKEFEKGKPAETATLRLELKLIADVGFVGLPNVGKSTLLNSLTNAKSRVADYQFTTLEPHLGAYYELILADIPGLIEGASDGKGLGIKFLRHIERTKILFHFVSAESEDVVKDYQIIRKELGAFNPDLLKKKEYVFLSKSDMTTKKEIKEKTKLLKKLNPKVLPLSFLDDESVMKVKKLLNKIKDKNT
jgi:GTPase